MPRMSTLNKKFQTEGFEHLELIKGDGYFYFCFWDGKYHDTESVYVFRFSHYPYDRWFKDGVTFNERILKEKESS